jgi:outer membrane autotransporter protein
MKTTAIRRTRRQGATQQQGNQSMSIRHIARAIARNHDVSGSRLFRVGLGALLLVGSLGGHVSIAADAGDGMGQIATLAPSQPDSGPMTVAPGKDLVLTAVEKIDDQGVAGKKVEWTASGPGSATLTPAHSKTAAQSATTDAGVATSVFHAAAPGNYVVTATTQKNPGCSSASCATYVSIRYAVDVEGTPAADAPSNSGGITRAEEIGAAVGLGVAIAAAVDNNSTSHSEFPSLASVSGDGQGAGANAALARPLVVHASNNSANAVGVGIQWSASGGAILSSATSTTDNAGVASITVKSVGPGPGPVTITATRSDDSSATVSFTANVLQRTLTIVSGDGQSGLTNTKVANPVVVEALLGNSAQVGVPIAWAVSAGDATIISSNSQTNASGQASASIKFDKTAGPVAITATRTDGSGISQTFHLTSLNVQTLVIVSGNNQTGFTNTQAALPLDVQALDNGIPQAGLPMAWAVTGGSATIVSSTTPTNADGQSHAIVRFGAAAGAVRITATLNDGSGRSQTFQLTATLVQSLRIVSGNNQIGPTNTTVQQPLIVQTTQNNLPQVGAPMTWTVNPGSSATILSSTATTDSNGESHATVRFGPKPGIVNITATVNDGSGRSQTFQLTSTRADALNIISGNGQNGAPNAQLPAALVVQALTNGLDASGVTINWSASTGTLSSQTSVTGPGGKASIRVINTGDGSAPVVVTASRADDPTLTATFTEAVAPPTLTKVGGDGQQGLVNTPAPANLIVKLVNANGTPVSGQPISWTVTGGSASVSAPSTNTGPGGAARVGFSYGGTPGPIRITATAYSGLLSVTFAETAASITGLTAANGNNQFGAANTTLPQRLEAHIVTPPGTTGIKGVPITFTVTGGTAQANPSSVTTDSSGDAYTTLTLGADPGQVTVVAQVVGTSYSAPFTETISVGTVPTTLMIKAGNHQTLTAGKQSAVMTVLLMANNVALAGQTIQWTTANGSLAPPSSVTDQNGLASTYLTPSSAGSANVVANFAANAQFAATQTTLMENSGPQLPTTLTISPAGNNQTITVGTQSAVMTVELKANNVPLAGQTIQWTTGNGSLNPTSSVTDPNGLATTQLTPSSVGSANVVANFAGQAQYAATHTTLTENGGPQLPTAVTMVTGNNQTIEVGAKSAVLTVVLKANNVALVGETIQWSTTSGSLTNITSQTDQNGEARTHVTPTSSGQIHVTANFPGHVKYAASQFVFSENTAPLIAGALTIVSGNNQAIALNIPSAPLVVVLNENGKPLAGQTINWSTSAGTLSTTSGVTNGSGQASVTVTPTAAGPLQVTASFPGHAQFAPAQVMFAENTALTSLPTQTTNDQQVSGALDTACSSLQSVPSRTPQQQDLLNQCLALSSSSTVSTAAAAVAVHQLIPDVTETQSQTATTATTAQFNNLAGRMTQLRGGAQGVSLGGLSFTNDVGSLPMFDVGSALLGADDKPKQDASSSFSRWGFFASGQIGRQDSSSQNGTPAYNLDISGLTFGADYRKTDSLVLGGAVGYTRQSTTLANDDGNLGMNGWSLSGYATWYQKNNWYVDSSITWANNNYDSQRHIDYSLPLPDGTTSSVDQLATASSGGNNLAGSLTFGRDFSNKAWSYGFYGKAQYSRQEFDAFQEQLNDSQPGSGLGLRVDQRTINQVDSVLGAKVDHTFSTSWGVVIPHAEAEWQHEFDGTPNAFRAFFEDDPTNTPILITGTPIDNNFFRLGLGVSFVFTQGRSAFILYDRTLGETGITAYNLSFGFRMEF